MPFYSKSSDFAINYFNSNLKIGLTNNKLKSNIEKYGYNRISQKKNRSVFNKILDALKEPMILILLFGFVIILGANLGSFFKSGNADFVDCFGILGAIFLSVAITVFMEGSSEKAFLALNKIYQHVAVNVIRDGQRIVIDRAYLTVGDIVLLESGDKIVADGRLVESEMLSVDESSLTGESMPVKKDSNVVLKEGTPLADRLNCVYSGTFVTSGFGKMLVTNVGDKTEMGKIAEEMVYKLKKNTPLQNKLTSLGKIITIVGTICATIIFAISVVRLVLMGNLTFNSLSELFISAIILIVAAVPEGLPTIVAVSLALNMIKLAKENALIRKMSATETAGAVSVICSDKTGTLTQNKMSVVKICTGEHCFLSNKNIPKVLVQNFILNSSSDVVKNKSKISYVGSGTECALLKACDKSYSYNQIKDLQESVKNIFRIPFSSAIKYMATVVHIEGKYMVLVKGAPEKVLDMCNLTEEQKAKILNQMNLSRNKAQRILCFAHKDSDEFSKETICSNLIYDGFVALADPIRKDVKNAVKECKRAGIKIKMLTGDNMVTALAIAKELDIAKDESCVINASYLENLTEEQFTKIIQKVTVVARSTPIIKLRIIKALQNLGEVVAVTGDGINDAPAIKQADVGIAMGISGSDITKETADIVLLDDSFATVVKAVAFGRNVYQNLQRFILFQLSVNLSALIFITACALLGLSPPFNTIQLLWINVIMDGPPALTLGLEKAHSNLMNRKPVKRVDSIVSGKMLLRILFNGLFISFVLVFEYLTGFIGKNFAEKNGVIFTLFVLFQLFNAFNSRELGAESIFKNINKNKIMVWTFLGVFFLHILIVQFCYPIFNISPISISSWIKCVICSSTIVFVSELYKLVYRCFKKRKAF